MSKIELVDKDRPGPATAICPRCGKKMIFNIDMFKDNITKIVESKCPYCSGKLFSCILILTNTNMPKLLDQLKRVITSAKGENKIIKM